MKQLNLHFGFLCISAVVVDWGWKLGNLHPSNLHFFTSLQFMPEFQGLTKVCMCVWHQWLSCHCSSNDILSVFPKMGLLQSWQLSDVLLPHLGSEIIWKTTSLPKHTIRSFFLSFVPSLGYCHKAEYILSLFSESQTSISCSSVLCLLVAKKMEGRLNILSPKSALGWKN